jgi:hypothetical protein
MTVMHPGFGFEKRWGEARFPFFDEKARSNQEVREAGPEVLAGSNQDNIQAIAMGDTASGERIELSVSKMETVHEVKE